MDEQAIGEVRDLVEDALASATDAASVVASALGLGTETDDGYEVDADELEGSDDPAAQALGRVLNAMADLVEALGDTGEPTEEPADGDEEAA